MADNTVQTLSRMIAEKMLGKAKNTSGEAEMQARSLPPDPTAKEAVLKRMMLTQAPQRVPYDLPSKLPGWDADAVQGLMQNTMAQGTGKGLGPTPNPDDYADSTSKLALAPGGQSALVQDTSGDQAMEDFLKKNPQAGPMPKPRIATLR